jgi:hypothetical protein
VASGQSAQHLVSDDGNVIMIDNYPKPLPLTAEQKAMIEKVSKTRSEALAKKQFSVQHWINDLPWDRRTNGSNRSRL